jgi:hypothetical protein
MLLRSMSADPNTVSTPKLLATGDYTDSYSMINSVNALVVSTIVNLVTACNCRCYAIMITKISHASFFCEMWFKIFKYISITKRLTRISKALFKALPDVGAFFFVFVILFIGFGLSAHLLFGNDILGFSSIGETFLTLFRMMLGDWDYQAMVMSAPIMGPVRSIFLILHAAIVTPLPFAGVSLHYCRSCLCCGFARLRSFCLILSSVFLAKRTTK